MNRARKVLQQPQWKPGDSIQESGVYEVIHSNCRSPVKDAIFIAGQELPPCRSCGSRVRFRLRQTIPSIFDDQDFKK
ncbi:MAG TPA: hypothetical protein VJ453_02730 [Terriglobales bacterium]|jgi:hypothetical protein|nr:hypothetical protein [Terriglobales bacterium]